MESKFGVNFLTRHPRRTRGNRAEGVANQGVVYRIAAEHGTSDLGSKSGSLQRDSSIVVDDDLGMAFSGVRSCMVAETQDEQDFYDVYHDILPKVFTVEELTQLG